MYTNLINIEILSTNPLWVYDGELQCLNNNYCNKEVVRIYKGDGLYYDIPIRGKSVIIRDLGVILYKRQEDAIRYREIESDVDTLISLINNSFNNGYMDKSVKQSNNYSIDFSSGIYSISDFDDLLSPQSMLHKIGYLDNNKNYRNIKKVNSNNLINYINDYLLERNLDLIGDISSDRILFDVRVENNKVYVDGFSLSPCSNIPGPMFWSTLNNFPLFTSKFEAQIYRYEHGKNKNVQLDVSIEVLRKQKRMQKMLQKQEVDQKIVDTVNTACGFVINDLKLGDKIVDGANNLCNNIANKKHKSKFPTPRLRNKDKDIRIDDDIFIAF